MGVFPKMYEEVDHMLTPKQNMLEVIKGGNPDRFVNQYEAVQLLFHPFMFTNPLLQRYASASQCVIKYVISSVM